MCPGCRNTRSRGKRCARAAVFGFGCGQIDAEAHRGGRIAGRLVGVDNHRLQPCDRVARKDRDAAVRVGGPAEQDEPGFGLEYAVGIGTEGTRRSHHERTFAPGRVEFGRDRKHASAGDGEVERVRRRHEGAVFVDQSRRRCAHPTRRIGAGAARLVDHEVFEIRRGALVSVGAGVGDVVGYRRKPRRIGAETRDAGIGEDEMDMVAAFLLLCPVFRPTLQRGGLTSP